MSKIYMPIERADQWAQFLADPEKHWQTGYSARTLAHSWQDAEGFPAEVQRVLESYPPFRGIELLLAFPEHKVSLPGGARPSQNDVWALARTGSGLVSLAVEGKVAEPFGPTLAEWLTESSPGKATRLEFLKAELGLPFEVAGTVRYQLLHRAASAILEARRFGAAHAVLLVHSFSQSHQWFEDYAAFADLLGARVAVDGVSSAGNRGGVELHTAWVCGDAAYLAG